MKLSRTKRVLLSLTTLALLAGGVTFGLSACHQPERVTGVIRPASERDRKLVSLAAEEAALFDDIDARLTRQLNLADQQLQRGWTADAPVTLKGARDTLLSKDASKLTFHARLSGWVSISELSRNAKDIPAAASACDHAIKELKAIDNQASRCKYVMGIANEAQYLKGLPAARDLLVMAGPWAREISNQPERRSALTTFASALFNLDEYAAGQTVMRQDPDAAWRSETLSALASAANPENAEPTAARAAALSRDVAAPQASQSARQSKSSYGVPLNYRTVFEGKQRSETQSTEAPQK